MLALWEEDKVSVKALGARLELDSGTLSPLCKRLERAGLVGRRSEKDERQVIIFLTEIGALLKEQASDLPEQLGYGT